MKKEKDYVRDIAEIRSMMERSTRFLSLSGLSGIMAGIYALVGAFVAYRFFYMQFDSGDSSTISAHELSGDVWNLIILALIILGLAVGTGILLSSRKAKKNNEYLWNPIARRLAINMAIPLITGGILILILIFRGLLGLIAPLTLIFYGLALLNASKFTFNELRSLGIIEIILGLISSYFIGYGLTFWAVGFGVMHIAYGIYMHLRYEK